MIDLNHLEQYTENNRIEAKKALGGLPHSIWETYSAFANTMGGLLLLGVEEHRDKSLHPVDLPDPERLRREFWAMVNDPRVASVNILSPADVTIETVEGKQILVIRVPRAERAYQPVYVEGNPLNTYRRKGEGDCRCSREELQAMVRDADERAQDLRVWKQMEPEILDGAAVRAYRDAMARAHPGHPWEKLDDASFLQKAGALGIDDGGKLHPTSAGLLLFGCEPDIVRAFPRYFLDYREEADTAQRICSISGEWSGGIYEFYIRVCARLLPELDVHYPADVGEAVREAIVNSLVNADYRGSGGLTVIRAQDSVTISNPGSFRIGLDAARTGGLSDPRNGTLLKLFNLIDVGRHAGSGIPGILHVWRTQRWPEPEIAQSYGPDRTTVVLRFGPKQKTGRSKSRETPVRIEAAAQKALLIDELTDRAALTPAQLARLLGIPSAAVRILLKELEADGIVVASGKTYRLKA